jgi:DNA-binding MarR family transcriptional regulator
MRRTRLKNPDWNLENFVPFRLNRLANAVSEHLSEIYTGRFGLQIAEWRVLVTVGRRRDCTAQQIVSSTRMHKSRVSRAVAALVERGLLERESNEADARAWPLCLTAEGVRLYEGLIPLALGREAGLISQLSTYERRGFLAGITKLERILGLG